MSPDSVRLPPNTIVELSIAGAGFDPGRSGQNSVHVGPIRLDGVPADDAGTLIRIVLPERVPGTAESPPRRLMPATYPVTVTTSAGVSNAFLIRVLP